MTKEQPIRQPLYELELWLAQTDPDFALDWLRNIAEHNEVVTDVGRMLSNFRQSMIALPSAVTPQVARLTNAREVERVIKDRVYEALDEISRYEPEGFDSCDQETIEADSAAEVPN